MQEEFCIFLVFMQLSSFQSHKIDVFFFSIGGIKFKLFGIISGSVNGTFLEA